MAWRAAAAVAATAAFAAGALGGVRLGGSGDAAEEVSDEERRRRWDTIAPTYSSSVCVDERALGITALRRVLCRRARGDVLEVAAGTAANLRYYSPAVDSLTLVDRSNAMCQEAAAAVAEVAERAPASAPLLASPAVEGEMALYLKSPRKTADAPPVPKMQPRTVPVRLRIASAEQLPFSDASFDTVTDTFGLCSFDDPLRALREMARVCKPGGHVLLLEHGRAGSWSPLTWFLDWRASSHAKHWGCVWNRDIDALVSAAASDSDCEVVQHERSHLGTIQLVVLQRRGSAATDSSKQPDTRESENASGSAVGNSSPAVVRANGA